ncbi:MAG TPA: patatin-like phospholipase family protein [Candidatus Dormibacteraeota bacterium]|nr:patatin-like phospholipase family protein [Candidatus Dormibacteraeota bacterium]
MSTTGWLRLRRLVHPRLGVVLGGGAALGAVEAGAIETFGRRGLVPDLLVGTSVGAINAAFWAFDPEQANVHRLLRLWKWADRSTMVPDHGLAMLGRVGLGMSALTAQRGVARMVRAAGLEDAAIEESRIPLAVVTTDADSGQRVVLRQGPLLPALLASAAIPVLYPAVEVDGRRLVDGGVVANCDVDAAAESGMTDVLVVDIMGMAPETGRSLWDVADRTVRTVLRRQTDLAIRGLRGRARIAVLRPTLGIGARLDDFSQTVALYRAGRDAAEAFLAGTDQFRRWQRGRRTTGRAQGHQGSRPGAGATDSGGVARRSIPMVAPGPGADRPGPRSRR